MPATPVEQALEKLPKKRSGEPRLKKPQRQAIPLNLEREYLRKLNKILNKMERLVKAKIINELPKLVEQNKKKLPATDRMDISVAKKVAQLFVALNKSFSDIPNGLKEGAAEDIGKKVNKFNKAQVGRVFTSVVGVDLLGGEPFLKEQLEIFSIGNTALIKDVTQKFADDTQQIVMSGLRRGLRHEEIAKQILGRTKDGQGLASTLRKAKKRAATIARDQVSKLNGQLTKLRQENAGVKQYIWRTVRDARVRDSHAAREGDVFDWNKPPSDGHPGEPINCRCFAEPVLDDLI